MTKNLLENYNPKNITEGANKIILLTLQKNRKLNPRIGQSLINLSELLGSSVSAESARQMAKELHKPFRRGKKELS